MEQWNKTTSCDNPGTTASQSVPPLSQSSTACGTSAEVGCKAEADNFLYDFEERISIAEYDGGQTSTQAQRIAYVDVFITILSDLAENTPHQDWLAQQIQLALASLERQNFLTLNWDFFYKAAFIHSFPNIWEHAGISSQWFPGFYQR